MDVIEYLLIIAQSVLLTFMGYSASTWQWWAIIICTEIYGLIKLGHTK